MKSESLSKIIKLLSIVVIFSVFAACTPAAAPAEQAPAESGGPTGTPIKIGVPAQLTGYAASDGFDTKAGAEMAVEDLNAKGGVLGRPVELVVYDTKDMLAEDAIGAAKFLVEDEKVDLVLSSYLNVAVDVQEFGKYDVPYLSAGGSRGTTDAITADFERNFNCFMYTDDERSNTIQNYKNFNSLGYEWPTKTVALLTEDYQYNMWVVEAFRETATADGWQVVVDELFPMGTVEWKSQLSKIRAANPDLIFLASVNPADAVTFLKQFLENPTNSVVYMQYVPSQPEFVDLAGEQANGLIYSVESGALPGPKADDFKQRFTEKYDRKPGYYIPQQAYDMVMMWAQAVETVGDPTKYREIAEHFVENPFTGICGTYKFRADNHVVEVNDETFPLHTIQFQNGEQVLLFPKKYASGTFQIPPWIKVNFISRRRWGDTISPHVFL